MNYEGALKKIRGWGRYQKLQTLLLVVSTIPNGMMTMMSVFILDVPDHHCTVQPANLMIDLPSVEDADALINQSIPLEVDENGKWMRSKCKRFSKIGNTSSTTECDVGWTYYPKYSEHTVLMEWNLVCDRRWIKPLMLALFMFGILVGSMISGFLADRFGRRPTFLWGTALQFVSVFVMGFSSSPAMFATFMFISGFSLPVNYVTAFVIVTEIVQVSKRALVGTLIYLGYTVGYMILPPVAYFLTNWRWLSWFIGAGGVLYVPFYWLIPESPRWLIINGKPEARQLIRRIAKFNGASLTADELMSVEKQLGDCTAEKEVKQRLTYLDLFRPAAIRTRTLVMFFIWVTITLAYYCISLGTSNLGGNKFVNCFVSAAVEIPAFFSCMYFIDKFGRKPVLIAYLVAGGATCAIASAFLKVNSSLLVTFAMMSKFCATAAFSLVYIYCCELFPTNMRNMSVGASSTMARVGGIVAPYLIYAGESVNPIIPYITMGGFAIISGLLTLLLPDTWRKSLPETVEDAIKMTENQPGSSIAKADADDESSRNLNL